MYSKPYIVLPVHAVIQEGMRVRPEVIFLEKGNVQKVRLTALDDKWDNISATCKNNAVDVQIIKRGKGRYILDCQLNTLSMYPESSTSIIISNGHDKIILPVVLPSKK